VKPVPRLFLDASVWIAAAGSATGGSAVLLELCRQGWIRVVTSRLVLLEAERNIRAKLKRKALLRFYREIAAQSRIIHPKDAHVLAAGVKGRVDFLLTLDRKDFMTSKVLHAGLPFRIMTPGDFLQSWIENQA